MNKMARKNKIWNMVVKKKIVDRFGACTKVLRCQSDQGLFSESHVLCLSQYQEFLHRMWGFRGGRMYILDHFEKKLFDFICVIAFLLVKVARQKYALRPCTSSD